MGGVLLSRQELANERHHALHERELSADLQYDGSRHAVHWADKGNREHRAV